MCSAVLEETLHWVPVIILNLDSLLGMLVGLCLDRAKR